MQIEDGQGTGRTAGVNIENRLLCECVSASVEHHVNHHSGEAYQLLFSATPAGAGDCFLYVKNTSETDLVVEGFRLKLAASEYIDIVIGDTGTPVGGTDITPVNCNAGSGNVATGTFQHGNDITGLAGGSTVDRIYHLTSAGSETYNFEQDIIVPKNKVFTMYCQTGTTALAGVLIFNYHDQELAG